VYTVWAATGTAHTTATATATATAVIDHVTLCAPT
jgi:hypothetical protein